MAARVTASSPVHRGRAVGAPRDQAAALRRDGRITVAGLTAADDAEAEARRMGCTFILRDGQVAALN